MKQKTFEIKVGDLLKNPGKQDTVEFEKLMPESLSKLTEDGIRGKIILQAINADEIIAKLQEVECAFNESCDRCVEDFVRKVECPEFISRFKIADSEEEFADEDDLFIIDTRGEFIDIEDMILQSILLQDPISVKCSSCEKIAFDDEDEDEYSDYFESSSNITFS